jgi:hypothetical protein
VFRNRKSARQFRAQVDAESTGPISFGRRGDARRPKEITLCSQCLCGELFSNIVFCVFPHMVAIEDVKLPDLFQCNRGEDAYGEVDDLFPKS